MLQKTPGVARIFGGNHVAFAQSPQRAQRDVLQVPYRRGNQVKRTRGQWWQLRFHSHS